MNLINETSFTFLSKSSNESFARISCCAFISSIDPTIEELADIKTAVSEAVTNCIVHAYSGTYGKIYLNIKIYDNSKIVITIKDKGCGIKDVNQACQPLFTTGNDERAGLGFSVMENFMDKLKVRSKPDVGTTVVLEKTLKKRGYYHVGGGKI